MARKPPTHSSPAPASCGPAPDQHDGLVHAVLRRQWGGTLPYAERLQAGRIGLWQASRHFDATRGTTFSTYAWPIIARHIWREVAQSAPPAHEVSTPTPPIAAPDLDADLHRQEISACLHRLIAALPPPQQQVIVLYYGLASHSPHSLRQLGRRLGLSHEMVRQRLLYALVLLRHPATSLPLRQLLGCNTTAAYAQADALAQRYLRRRRGRDAC